MRPFWIRSGLALLDVDADGGLLVTDDFLRAYVLRPELAPIDESCGAERALHARLLEAPRAPVSPEDLHAIADDDARDNWGLFLRFRARLLRARTLQACYVRIFDDARIDGRVDVPPLFIDQIAQILMHHALVDCEDGLTLRMAELWFREQRATIQDGRVLLADAETVESRLADPGLGELGRLLAQANTPARGASLDMLDRDNAADYFGRDERHDFAVELGAGRASAYALADALMAWVEQMCGVPVRIRPVESIDDAHWRWHVGLDAQASGLLDALYDGSGLDAGAHRRLLLLMRLEFVRLADMREEVAGKPVHLALAMDEQGMVRMKPQNLLLNLPLARPVVGRLDA